MCGGECFQKAKQCPYVDVKQNQTTNQIEQIRGDKDTDLPPLQALKVNVQLNSSDMHTGICKSNVSRESLQTEISYASQSRCDKLDESFTQVAIEQDFNEYMKAINCVGICDELQDGSGRKIDPSTTKVALYTTSENKTSSPRVCKYTRQELVDNEYVGSSIRNIFKISKIVYIVSMIIPALSVIILGLKLDQSRNQQGSTAFLGNLSKYVCKTYRSMCRYFQLDIIAFIVLLCLGDGVARTYASKAHGCLYGVSSQDINRKVSAGHIACVTIFILCMVSTIQINALSYRSRRFSGFMQGN